jgi:hypothetical protein
MTVVLGGSRLEAAVGGLQQGDTDGVEAAREGGGCLAAAWCSSKSMV